MPSDSFPRSDTVLPSAEPDLNLESFEEPPLWPVVIGWISCIFAGLLLTCTASAPLMMHFFSGMVEQQLNGNPMPPNMILGPVQYIQIALGLLHLVLLMAAGITTLRRIGLGRTLHLMYALLAIPLFAFALMMVFKQNSAMREYIQQYPDSPFAQQQAQAGQFGLLIGIVMLAVFSLSYPAFLFIWFALVKRRPEDMGRHLVPKIV